MKILDDVKLDFCDVLLLPKNTQYESRSEVCLERTMKFKYSPYTWTGIPIMVSNMDTTGTIEMAKILQKHKIITCLNKYYTSTEILSGNLDKEYYAVSSGIQQNDLENLDKIMKEIDPKFICMDVANGYMNKFIKVCTEVREKYPNKIIIGGNVCTSEGVLDLVKNGKVDIVKVGIGNGSCCTTRKQTGIGVPQLSAIIECSDTAHGIDAHIISDGGLIFIGDFSKAYAAGADFVMSGSIFAGHSECAGDIVMDKNNNKYKIFYGMSSTTAMEKYSYPQLHKYRSSEGKTVKISYKGFVEDTIYEILGGIRSSMTYMGAKIIKDIPKCATFIRVNRQLNNIYTDEQLIN